MKRLALLTFSFLVLLDSGCTASGPRYTQTSAVSPGKAALYIYRERKMAGSGGSPNIYVNGIFVGKLPSGGYFVYEVSPGEVHFSNEFAFGPLLQVFAVVDRIAQAKKQSILSIEVSPNRAYYIEWMPGYRMAVRSQEEARPILSDCSLVAREPD